MRTRTILLATILTATLLGCGSKDESPAKTDHEASGSAPAPAPAPAPRVHREPVVVPAEVAITSSDNYKTRADALNSVILDVFKESDCDKLAVKIMQALESFKVDIAAINQWEKANPNDKKQFDEASAQKMSAATAPTMTKCKDNAAFKAAAAEMDAAGN